MNFIKKTICCFLRLFTFICLAVVSKGYGEPIISGVNGTVSNSSAVIILGSGFGSKASAAPLAFGDMENNSVSARIGNWTQTGYPSGVLSVSTTDQRHPRSSYNATCNFSVQNQFCSFQNSTTSPTWYAQYWVYLDSTFSWGNANMKLFRLWNSASGQNLRIQSYNRVDAVVENVNSGHDVYGTGWNQVVPGTASCADEVFGHKCNTSDWLPGSLEWRNFQTDIAKGAWHLFQFEFKEGTANTQNGVLRWWVDGKRVLDRSDVRTRTDSGNKYLHTLGFYRDALNDGSGIIKLDDVYVDTTWQRIEIGNNAIYNNCTLKEIQPATAWGDTSITFTVNQGAFSNGATGYLFVTDANGTRNTGYAITFGTSAAAGGAVDTTAPTVSITSPLSGTTITGKSVISASASDNVGISKVEFYVDSLSTIAVASVLTPPYSFTFDPSTVSNGTHVIYAKAYDFAGNSNVSSTSVTVSVSVASTPTIVRRNECAAPPTGSIFCEDFEGSNPKANFNDYDGNPDTENLIVTDPGPVMDSLNKAIRFRVPTGQAGSSDLLKVLPASYDVLYARWFFKYETGFNFNALNHGGGLTAGDRSFVGVSGNRPTGSDFASFLMQYNDQTDLPQYYTSPYAYTYYRGMYQNCANPSGSCWGDSLPCVYDTGSPSCTKSLDRPNVAMPTLVGGKWYCYEQMIDMGTPSTTGTGATGRLTQWLDGNQIGDNTNLWLRTSSSLKLQNLWLNLYHSDGTHSTVGELIDNVVVSTQRIGCGGPLPVSAPTGVQIKQVTP